MTWLSWAGTLIPFGFLTPILFAVAATRVHKREWLGWAALYGVVTYGGLVATFIGAEDSDLDGAGSLARSCGSTSAWSRTCARTWCSCRASGAG